MVKRLLIIVISVFSLTLSAIDVEKWQWGFDGTVVEKDVNILSVMVSNPSPVPFEGVVYLQKHANIGAPLGTPLVKKVFLSAYAKRWIQFYPYIKTTSDDWHLTWGKKINQKSIIKTPSSARKAIVYLTPDKPLFRNSLIRIPHFRESLFPPTVAATSGLVGVVIDTPPEFTPLQKQAFKEWLYSGGKVHITIGSNGLLPDFGPDYSFLNIRGKRGDVGAGQVIKHTGQKVLTPATLGVPSKIKVDDDRIYTQDSDDSFFRKLRRQLKTKHNWGLIFFISIIYGLLVTVVNFIVGRKSKKTWKPLAFFAGTVILFSLLLAWCGRRGYGEKSQILALTYARELDKNSFEITQWMDIFVTDGDYYKISHKNKTDIYSTCQSMNSINGETYNGSGGFFLVDIPLFSSMQLFHKSDATTSKDVGVEGDYRFFGSELKSLNLKLSEDFPQPILEVKAIANERIYTLYKGSKWNEYKRGTSQSVSEYLKNWNNSYGYYNYYSQDDEDPVEIFKSMVAPLIVRSRGGDSLLQTYYPTPCAIDNKIDIYVMAETPEDFKSDKDVIKKEKGYTLFHFILP